MPTLTDMVNVLEIMMNLAGINNRILTFDTSYIVIWSTVHCLFPPLILLPLFPSYKHRENEINLQKIPKKAQYRAVGMKE